MRRHGLQAAALPFCLSPLLCVGDRSCVEKRSVHVFMLIRLLVHECTPGSNVRIRTLVQDQSYWVGLASSDREGKAREHIPTNRLSQ